MKTLTTEEAETIYHIPAATFAEWCRKGKLPASKVGGEWQIAISDIDAFLTANPALRPAPAQGENRTWTIFGAIATMLGFLVDAVALRDIIRGGDQLILWILAGLVSLALWVAALVVLRPHLHKGRLFRLTEQPRFTSRPLLIAARIVAVGMPLMLVLGFVGYNVWRVVPPNQTVVLVADFRDPTGVDSARVTQSLVEGMRETLKEQPNIQVRRLNQFIAAEGGSEQARAIGNRPEHKAAFVIWGDYTLDPEPELYVHFDMLLDRVTNDVGAGVYEEYGPGQIHQPNMFDFKAELGTYLGELTAFASAVALYEVGEHDEAIPLFDTAAEAVGQRLAARWERPIRFYRGANLLNLGRASEAATDLRALVPPFEDATSPVDGITLSAMVSLGLVEIDQGNLTEAKAHLGRALGISRQRGDRLGEVVSLNNLGLVAFDQSDLPTARNYFEAALVISRQIGSRENEAKNLGNLGLVARNQGDYSRAGIYHEQALMIYRQLHLRMGEASQLGNLALIARNMGDYRTAAAYHTQALVIDRELGNTRGEAADLSGLGLVAIEQKAYSTAKDLHRQALELHRRLRDPLSEAKDLGNLGIIAIREGEHATAKEYLEQAQALYHQLGNLIGESITLGNLGGMAYAQGDYVAAKSYVEQSLALYRQLGHRLGEAQALGNLGMAAFDLGDSTAAKAYLEQSAQLYQQMGLPVPSSVQSALKKLAGQK